MNLQMGVEWGKRLEKDNFAVLSLRYGAMGHLFLLCSEIIQKHWNDYMKLLNINLKILLNFSPYRTIELRKEGLIMPYIETNWISSSQGSKVTLRVKWAKHDNVHDTIQYISSFNRSRKDFRYAVKTQEAWHLD